MNAKVVCGVKRLKLVVREVKFATPCTHDHPPKVREEYHPSNEKHEVPDANANLEPVVDCESKLVKGIAHGMGLRVCPPFVKGRKVAQLTAEVLLFDLDRVREYGCDSLVAETFDVVRNLRTAVENTHQHQKHDDLTHDERCNHLCRIVKGVAAMVRYH